MILLLSLTINKFQPSLQPTSHPSSSPTSQPSYLPSQQPTSQPSLSPTSQPSSVPTNQPTSQPSKIPSCQPSSQPSLQPSCQPSSSPSSQPTSHPTFSPSQQPSSRPSRQPSCQPSSQPSRMPTKPSSQPSSQPSSSPSQLPSSQPSSSPSAQPSSSPSAQPSTSPSSEPSVSPTVGTQLSLSYTVSVSKSATSKNPNTINGYWNPRQLGKPSELNLEVTISDTKMVNSSQYIVLEIVSVPPSAVSVPPSATCYYGSSENPCTGSKQCIYNFDVSKYIQPSYGGNLNITFRAVCGDYGCQECSISQGALTVYTLNLQLTQLSVPTLVPTLPPTTELYCSLDNSPKNDSTSRAYTAFGVLFSFMGVFLYIIRKGSKSIYQFSIFTMVFQLSVLGIDLISDLMYIVFLYDEKIIQPTEHVSIVALATIMLVTRIIHPIQTWIVASTLMGKRFQDYYLKLVDKDHFVQFGKEYGLLFLVSIFESTSIKFFPWLESEFIRSSGGYPTEVISSSLSSLSSSSSSLSSSSIACLSINSVWEDIGVTSIWYYSINSYCNLD